MERYDEEDEDQNDSRRSKFRSERAEAEDTEMSERSSSQQEEHSYESRGRKREKSELSRSTERSRSSSNDSSDKERPHHRRERYRSPKRESPPSKRRKTEEWTRSPPRAPMDRYGSHMDSRDRRGGGRGGGYRGGWSSSFGARRINESVLYEGPLKSYKQFMELQDDNITSAEAEKKYEAYKQDYNRRHAKNFFTEHKNDEWFKEKYDPAYIEVKKEAQIHRAKNQLATFGQELLSGNFSWSLTLTGEEKSAEAETSQKEEQTETGELEEGEKEEEREEGEEVGEVERESADKEVIGDVTYNALFIKAIPPNIGRKEVQDFFSSAEGFSGLSLSEPNTKNRFYRIGWAIFQTKDQCYKALAELNGKRIKEFEIQMMINKTGLIQKKLRVTPLIASTDERLQIDLENATKLCKRLDEEKGLDNIILFGPDFESLPVEERLDKIINYMRHVHLFCYYCVEEYESEADMFRKCAIKHVRHKKIDDSAIREMQLNSNADNWVNTLELKLKKRLEDSSNFDVLTGKVEMETQLERFFKENSIMKDKDKFRCKECQKLFSGDQFVRKHLNLKHTDLIEIVKKKALDNQFFENYFRDPRHVTSASQAQQGVLPLPMGVRAPMGGFSSSRGRGLISPPGAHSHMSSGGPWHIEPPPFRGPPLGAVSSYGGPQSHHMYPPGPGSGSYYSSAPRGGRGRSRGGRPPGPPMSRGGMMGGYGSSLPSQYHPSPSRRPPSAPFTGPPRSRDQPPEGALRGSTGTVNYVDRDAPREEAVQIDYRSVVDYSEL